MNIAYIKDICTVTERGKNELRNERQQETYLPKFDSSGNQELLQQGAGTLSQ